MSDLKMYYKLIFDAIYEKKSLKDLMEELCHAMEMNIALILNSGEIVVGSEHHAVDGFWEEKRADLEMLRVLEQERVFTLNGSREWMMEPVLKDGKRVGSIVFDDVKCEEDEEYRTIAVALAEAVASMIPRSEGYYYRSWTLEKSILNHYLFESRNRGNNPELEKYFAAPYVAVMLECDDNSCEVKKLLTSRAVIEGERYYSLQGKSMVCIFGDVTTEQLVDVVKNTHIKAYISEQFETLGEFAERLESLQMISEISNLNSGEFAFRERDWYVKARLFHAKKQMKSSEIQNLQIQRLIYEDDKKNGELFETLKKYLICANNLAETAKELHIHRNTLVYRLKQIDEILEYNINDVKDSRELLLYMMLEF